MKRYCLLSICLGLGICLGSGLTGCTGSADTTEADTMPAPVCRIIPHEMEIHGDTRVDNYFWLRERENPEVIDYLEAENAYTASVMRHTEELQESLFEEIKGRIKQNDESVPYLKEGYYYYQRYEDGKEYPIHCRKQGTLDNPEQVILDVNEVAEGRDYCAVRSLRVSSDGKILAYCVDFTSRRFYDIYFKNLETGETFDQAIKQVRSNVDWANDNSTVFYSRQDPETLRPYQIYRYKLGADPASATLVYQEDDEEFRVYVFKSKSREYMLIGAFQTMSTEFRYLATADPDGEFAVINPREADHRYTVEHFQDRFYIRTNHEAMNYRLMSTPVERTTREHWDEVIAHRDDVFLSSFETFRDFLVVNERIGGLTKLRIVPWSGEGEHYLDFGEPAYAADLGSNYEFDTPQVRYEYSSLATPKSTYDYNMATREKTLLKQDEVLGGYDPADYRVERLHAQATDGTKIPISIVYRHDFTKDGGHPLLLYAYGSYGSSMDADFYSAGVSLLDRGFAYAIAHVRGGQELGRQWYEDGKLLKKKNSFTDFIACTDFLVAEGYTAYDRVFAWGGSAGGLLAGAVANMAPDKYLGIIAEVPWVDVVTTMLDSSIPLTTNEYDEWGNPNDKQYYDYMLSYSPYDNVVAGEYPHLLVTTGLHDSQVQYWEPSKWVAKMRVLKTDQHRLLLKTNMEVGHGGASGRYERYKETAFLFAFMLDLVGQTR